MSWTSFIKFHNLYFKSRMISRRSGGAYFADIIRTAIIWIKTTFKKLRETKIVC